MTVGASQCMIWVQDPTISPGGTLLAVSWPLPGLATCQVHWHQQLQAEPSCVSLPFAHFQQAQGWGSCLTNSHLLEMWGGYVGWNFNKKCFVVHQPLVVNNISMDIAADRPHNHQQLSSSSELCLGIWLLQAMSSFTTSWPRATVSRWGRLAVAVPSLQSGPPAAGS
jgi:hypothetical protein